MKQLVYKHHNKRKSRLKKGFSLFETLIALAIMVLFTYLLSTAMATSTQSYEKVVINTNADMLISNTLICLRDELIAASNIEISKTDKSITYNDGVTGALCVISNNANNGIMLNRYGENKSIITATQGLVTSYGDVEKTSNSVTFKNIVVKKDNVEYARLTEYVITLY